MLNRFKAGGFGVPVPNRGIGVPMDADSNTVGRATYFGPTNFGTFIPQEEAAQLRPALPRYRDVVTTGGNLPPEVVPGGVPGFFRRMLGRDRRGR